MSEKSQKISEIASGVFIIVCIVVAVFTVLNWTVRLFTPSGSDEVTVDRLDAEEGVERSRKERREERQENDRPLLAPKHENSERNPGEDGNRTKHLEEWERVFLEFAIPAHEEAERDAEHEGERERDQDSPQAKPDVRIVL